MDVIQVWMKDISLDEINISLIIQQTAAKQQKQKRLIRSQVMQRSVKKIRTMDGRQTSMALEPVYWTAIQRLSSGSGLTWKQWTEQQISKAPAGTRNLTSWIRSQVIQELMA